MVDVTLYPFSLEALPLIRHRSMLSNFNILNVVSPKGLGLTNKDCGEVDLGETLGFNIISDLYGSLEETNGLLLVSYEGDEQFDQLIISTIERTLQLGIKVYCFKKYSEKQLEKIRNMENSDLFIYGIYSEITSFYDNSDYVLNDLKWMDPRTLNQYTNNNNIILDTFRNRILTINTPILVVNGISERCDKFQVQLEIRKQLKQDGYRVSQIGSRQDANIFGMYSYPNFMFDNEYSESQKIIGFNRMVYEIERKEKPDIIIIGIPGGTMKFSNGFTNNFGIQAYLVSNALLVDYCIHCINYIEKEVHYYQMINDTCKYRFGYSVDYFCMSNTHVNWTETIQLEKVIREFVDSSKVNKALSKYKNKIPIISTKNVELAYAVIENVKTKLGEEENIVVI